MVTNRFHFKMLFCLQQARILAILYFSKTATALKTRKFSDINISQGSVVSHFRCDGIFNDSFICKFPGDCKGEKNLKIGQYLMKLRLNYYWFLFSGHGVNIFLFFLQKRDCNVFFSIFVTLKNVERSV